MMSTKIRLSVHMLVRNATGVIDRALRPLRGIADEVSYVDTGSTDGTPDRLVRLCAELGIRCVGTAVSPLSRPDLFFQDLPGTYDPLDLPGCGGSQLLRDWSAARNLGLDLCQGDYVMKLDADDEILMPENLLPTLDRLDRMPNVEVVACPYEVMVEGTPELDRIEMYTRLWRNQRHIRFREVCHENVDWCRRPDGSNWIMIAQGLTFRDWRDNQGSGVRVPHRNLKVLLHQFQSLSSSRFSPCSHLLIYLADEAATICPVLSQRALDLLPSELHFTDEAWSRVIRGRSFEALGLLTDAFVEYQRAVELGSRRAKLLSAMVMLRKNQDGWEDSLIAAIAENENQFYPKYASCSEVREAQARLGTLKRFGSS
jgi:hypothetical protein